MRRYTSLVVFSVFAAVNSARAAEPGEPRMVLDSWSGATRKTLAETEAALSAARLNDAVDHLVGIGDLPAGTDDPETVSRLESDAVAVLRALEAVEHARLTKAPSEGGGESFFRLTSWMSRWGRIRRIAREAEENLLRAQIEMHLRVFALDGHQSTRFSISEALKLMDVDLQVAKRHQAADLIPRLEKRVGELTRMADSRNQTLRSGGHDICAGWQALLGNEKGLVRSSDGSERTVDLDLAVFKKAVMPDGTQATLASEKALQIHWAAAVAMWCEFGARATRVTFDGRPSFVCDIHPEDKALVDCKPDRQPDAESIGGRTNSAGARSATSASANADEGLTVNDVTFYPDASGVVVLNEKAAAIFTAVATGNIVEFAALAEASERVRLDNLKGFKKDKEEERLRSDKGLKKAMAETAAVLSRFTLAVPFPGRLSYSGSRFWVAFPEELSDRYKITAATKSSCERHEYTGVINTLGGVTVGDLEYVTCGRSSVSNAVYCNVELRNLPENVKEIIEDDYGRKLFLRWAWKGLGQVRERKCVVTVLSDGNRLDVTRKFIVPARARLQLTDADGNVVWETGR